jgi:DNA-binding response OmpR family regulator
MPIHTVLIVEDEIIPAMALESGLRAAGFQTALALSWDEAIKQIECDKPDLVVIDINLHSTVDGIETARRIKDRFGIPIIFMTGYSDIAIRRKADEVGYLGYLVKPVEMESILAVIDAYHAKGEV